MPAQNSNANAAWAKVAAESAQKPFNPGGGGDLPEGIEGGVAILVDCKVGKFDKGKQQGEPFFYAAGTVVSPAEFGGMKIEGLRTSIMEPLCDTPDRQSRPKLADHIEWVYNQLKGLGVKPESIATIRSQQDLETICAALKQAKPSFRFRTWKGEKTAQFPNPRVNHEWKGAIAAVAAPADDVQDNSGPGDGGPDSGSVSEMSPTALGIAADNGTDGAAEKLTEIALAAGFSQKQVDGAESWTKLGEDVAEATGGGEQTPEADEGNGEWVPAKGEVYMFKPPKAKKAVECKITAVFEGNRTCNLQNLDDKSMHKGVSWDALEKSK